MIRHRRRTVRSLVRLDHFDRLSASPAYLRKRILATADVDWQGYMADVVRSVDVELAQVEELIRGQAHLAHPTLREPVLQICGAASKMLRPTVVVLAARLGTRTGPTTLKAAALIELLHVATLHHDDVMDNATTRRGVPSVNAHWGNTVAVLSGDFLLTAATRLAAQIDDELVASDKRSRREANGNMAKGVSSVLFALINGQIAELSLQYDVRRDEREYLESIRGKTASLFGYAADVGAIVSDAPPPVRDAVRTWAEEYGIGFQIVDDLLDFVSTEHELGKPAGNDIRQGVYTLPLIHALKRSPGLATMLGRDRPDLEAIRTAVFDTGGYDSAVGVARRYFESAAAALEPLRNPAADTLMDLTTATFARVADTGGRASTAAASVPAPIGQAR